MLTPLSCSETGYWIERSKNTDHIAIGQKMMQQLFFTCPHSYCPMLLCHGIIDLVLN